MAKCYILPFYFFIEVRQEICYNVIWKALIKLSILKGDANAIQYYPIIGITDVL